eukprot:TRINITY_DN4250_c0_g1_i1.p1 TRINITY_DN4250_c0_g1~~TRINITY_DN4250_c0_g1_i1.p1  ORF type:complete len:754 (+),score=232.16 TRINITY_DN4250_c0_g1_i1:272-2263(+)
MKKGKLLGRAKFDADLSHVDSRWHEIRDKHDHRSGMVKLQFKSSSSTRGVELNMDESPAMFAIRSDNFKKFEEITSKKDFDFSATDQHGYTLLNAATCVDHPNTDKILKMLLKMGKTDVNRGNKDQSTALHYFCANFSSAAECREIFQMFLDQGANVNARNSSGETPLHKALCNRPIRLLMVNLLLKAGSDPNAVTHVRKTSPLHYAVLLGRLDVIRTLVIHGADIHLRDAKNRTPYMAAVQEDKFPPVISLLQSIERLERWLKDNKLMQVMEKFLLEEISLELIPDLNQQHLKKMGLSRSQIQDVIQASKSLRCEFTLQSPVYQISNEDFNHGFKMKGKFNLTLGKFIEDLPEADQDGLGTMLKSEPIIMKEDLEFIRPIGSGAHAQVFEALYKDQKVAVKIFNRGDDEEGDREAIVALKKEFEIISQLNSPFMVQFIGACLSPRICMVMEYCEKGSLFSLLKEKNFNLNWEVVVQFSTMLAEGIEYLHDHDILHRDLKSLNILITNRMELKIGDFGLSRKDQKSETLGKFVGTICYLPPEMKNESRMFSSAGDIYAIGIILWEIIHRCVNGEYLLPFLEFNPQNELQAYFMVMEGTRPTIPAGTPTCFRELVQACWHQDALQRWGCHRLVDHMRHVVASEHAANGASWKYLFKGSLLESIE